MGDSNVLRVLPGDNIRWEVQVRSQSRLRSVRATFEEAVREHEIGAVPRRLVLAGDVRRCSKSGGRRISYADLSPPRSRGRGTTARDRAPPGVYGMRDGGERTLDLAPESLPSMVIRLEDEPGDERPSLGYSRMHLDRDH